MIKISNQSLFNVFQTIPAHLQSALKDCIVENSGSSHITLDLNGQNLALFKATRESCFDLLNKLTWSDPTYTFTLQIDNQNISFSSFIDFKTELSKL